MDNEQLKNDQISIIALDDSKLEGIARMIYNYK